MNVYKSAPRLDATNIAGITTLMNPQHIKSNIDLNKVENVIMKKEKIKNDKITDFDPIKYYTSEINKLAEELGVDIISIDNHPSTQNIKDIKSQEKVVHYSNRELKKIDEISLDLESERSIHKKYENIIQKHIPTESVTTYSKSRHTESSQSSSPDISDSSSSISKTSKTSKISKISKTSKTSKASKASKTSIDKKIDINKFISNLDSQIGVNLTSGAYEHRYKIPHIEHNVSSKKPTVIETVVSNINTETKTSYGIEREKLQDIKASKLEQISQLKMTLEEEGIDCSNVKHLNLDSTMDEIDSVLNVLRLKNDRNRYSTIAEEVILGMAEGIETVFDGSRTIPILKWSPDYRGYHSTVNIKLHRMRFETSQVVGNIIEKYNINPITRIIMELLPSFFLYPRQQNKQKNSPGIYSDPKISDASLAYESIKDMENRKREEELGNL